MVELSSWTHTGNASTVAFLVARGTVGVFEPLAIGGGRPQMKKQSLGARTEHSHFFEEKTRTLDLFCVSVHNNLTIMSPARGGFIR